MMNSLRVLFEAEHNKRNPVFALWRLLVWKCIKLLRLKRIRYKFWRDRLIYLNSDSFQSMWLMYNYIVDWEEFNLIGKYIKSNDQVADIGANMGFYSIWMSKFISASGTIHSFEPDQKNFKRLQENIKINNLNSTIQAYNVAVCDVDGALNFTVGLDGENHIIEKPFHKTIQVESVSLDTHAEQHNVSHLTYVKIDVEGFEYNVLKGAHKLLKDKRIQVIQLEINKTIQNSGASIDELLALLRGYSYLICKYDVEANKLLPIKYSENRENYFAVYDLQRANEKLRTI